MDLFSEAKKHWSNARRNLDSTGEMYDIHKAFMSLGQANWCLQRASLSSDATERVSKVIKTELDQMTQFLNSDPFAALDMKLDGNIPSEKDVKQAYRKLVKLWHPDKQNDKRGDRSEIAHELFIILQRAYEELKSDKTRQRLALRHNRVRHFNSTLRRGRRRCKTSRSRSNSSGRSREEFQKNANVMKSNEKKSETNFNLREFVARHAGIDISSKETKEEEEEEDITPNESNNWLLRPTELVALRAHFAAADFDDDGFLT